MQFEALVAVFHSATIAAGAWMVRQFKQTRSHAIVAPTFFGVRPAQAVPAAWSRSYSQQPDKGPMLWVSFLFLAPIGAIAAMAWLAIGGACWILAVRKS